MPQAFNTATVFVYPVERPKVNSELDRQSSHQAMAVMVRVFYRYLSTLLFGVGGTKSDHLVHAIRHESKIPILDINGE
jgi:hypothetical protein